MAIYRLYPEADTFITTLKSESNAGLDEIAVSNTHLRAHET